MNPKIPTTVRLTIPIFLVSFKGSHAQRVTGEQMRSGAARRRCRLQN